MVKLSRTLATVGVLLRKKAEKLAKFGIWDTVPEGSVLICGHTKMPLKHSTGPAEGSLPSKNQLDHFSYFNRTPTCDRRITRHSIYHAMHECCL